MEIDRESFISVEKVSKKFKHQKVLSEISLNVKKGEWLSLLGPSGCGKTTLLRIIAGLESADEGRIIHDGIDITTAPPSERRMGMVFQSYALFPNLTVMENVLYGLHSEKITRKEKLKRAEEVLAMVGLIPESRKFPSQLSGGQQQRTALARTLVRQPEVLLLDEPFSALDAQVRLSIRKELRQLQHKLAITTILVTHDQEEALTLSDKVAIIEHGKIVQQGTPQSIYEQPGTPFVAGFIGSMNFVNSKELTALKFLETRNGHSIYAIRPEHLRLSTNSENNNVIAAKVITKEYRGSFYRLGIEVGQQVLETPLRLEFDVSSAEFEQLRNPADETIPIEIDHEKFITFA